MSLADDLKILETDVEGWFATLDADVQAGIKALMPGALGLYNTIKTEAEAELVKVGSEAKAMLGADFQSLVATVKSAVTTAAANTTMTGVQKFEAVAKSILDQVESKTYPTILTIGTASLSALINGLYPALLAGLL